MRKQLLLPGTVLVLAGCATVGAPSSTPSAAASIGSSASASESSAADPTGLITIIPNAVADGPGTSIPDAIDNAPSTEDLVNGWLLIDAEGDTWLCEALSDSNPPVCTGARLLVEGFSDRLPSDIREADGVRWIPAQIQLFGDVTVP